MNKFLENLVIIEFIVCSGSIRFQCASPKVSMMVFLVTCFLFFVFKRGTKKINFIFNFKIISIITLWVFINTHILHLDKIDNSYLDYIFYLNGSGLAVTVFDFENFRFKLLKYLAYLSFISIIVQVWHDYFGLGSTFVNIPGNDGWAMSLYFFNTEWGENRLASIFWEPGQYQIVLIFVMGLFYKEMLDPFTLKPYLKHLLILTIALIMTISTSGYIAFGILISGAIVNSAYGRKHIYLLPLLSFLAFSIFLLLWNSDAVQKKIAQGEVNEENSFNIRMADNLALLTMVGNKPVFGYGAGTKSAEDAKNKFGSISQSNGWLRSAAENGTPYVLYILVLIYSSIKRRVHIASAALFLLFAFILSQSGEGNTYFPYTYMYVFKYCTQQT